MPELMKDYRKALYVDGDTVLLEDIAGLYHTDVSEYYAAVVRFRTH